MGAFLILIGQQANFVHWIGIYPLDKVTHSSYNWVLNDGPRKEMGPHDKEGN